MGNSWYLFIVAALLGASGASSASNNLIRNGDFEINGATAGASQVNLSNTAFTDLVNYTTAFGSSSELDLYTTDATYVPAPQSGAWNVRLHGDGGTLYDAFSLWLSSPVVAGASYTLSFHVSGLDVMVPHAPVSVAIGLSDDSGTLGTPIYTSNAANGTGGWNRFEYTFVAPVDAAYLTVRNISVTTGVDNFSLTPIPEPETWALLLAGLGLVGWAARGHRQATA